MSYRDNRKKRCEDAGKTILHSLSLGVISSLNKLNS